MSKKKGFLRGIGHVFEKLGRGCRKMVNGALNGVDKVVSSTNEAVKDSGIADALANTKIGFSAGLGENTGPQVYCQPANNHNTIGYGINTSSKSTSFFVNNQAVELTKKQSVEQLIAQRDELLQEVHGPGYIPESSLATMAGTAVASAAKFALDDAIALTNEVTEFHLNSTTAIYSANDTDRAEALNKNINKMQAVGQAISVVLTDPVIIPAHFENRAINASNSFAIAFDSGNLTSAGEAVGQMVYDIQTIAGTAAMACTTTGNVAKATNTFIRANEFRSPIVLQYDTARLNSGFPIDTIKLQNPVVKKGNPTNSAAGNVAQTEAIIGATQENTANLADTSVGDQIQYETKDFQLDRTINDPLRIDKYGNKLVDQEFTGKPHTQLGTNESERTGKSYLQGREFDSNGNLVKDIDCTDHGRPKDHTNPHQHKYVPNETGGTFKRSGPEPIDNDFTNGPKP